MNLFLDLLGGFWPLHPLTSLTLGGILGGVVAHLQKRGILGWVVAHLQKRRA